MGHYSLSRRLFWILLIINLIVVMLFTYQCYNRVKSEIRQQTRDKLYTVADDFEQNLSKDIIKIHNIINNAAQSASNRKENLEKILQPVMSQVLKRQEYSSLGLGYYSGKLKHSIVIGTAPEKHYINTVEAAAGSETGPVIKFTDLDGQNLAVYTKSVYWNGQSLGQVWVEKQVRYLYREFLKNMFWVLVLALVLGTLGFYLSYFISKNIQDSIAAFREEIELFINNPTHELVEDSRFNYLPLELCPLKKLIMDTLSKVQQMLHKLSRLGIMGEVVPVIAHEVRNPLTVIRGAAQVGKITDNPHKKDRYFDRIITNCDLTEKILKETMRLSQSSRAQVKDTVDIVEIIQNSLLILEPLFHKHKLTYEFKPEEGLPLIKGDPVALSQVIINVVKNSIEATPENGHVEVGIDLQNSGSKIRVFISDNGPGIPEEIQERLFEQFFTTKEAQGTGIGLALARRIVNEHDGEINFTTRPGQGTTFFIELPALSY